MKQWQQSILKKEFKHYLEIFTHDEELGKILAKVSFQELFNDKIFNGKQ